MGLWKTQRDPHHGGAGAGVGGDFGGGRLHFGKQLHFRLRQVDGAYGQAAVRLRRIGTGESL
jgi:hypothetical protein